MTVGQRVLIIEDDSRVAELYMSKLQRGRHEVDMARDGVSGVDLAGSRLPDAIGLDIHLSRLGRLAVLSVLSRQEAVSSVPVIMTTALSGLREPVSRLYAELDAPQESLHL
jgi:DNA-binding response OmpR family regulator